MVEADLLQLNDKDSNSEKTSPHLPSLSVRPPLGQVKVRGSLPAVIPYDGAADGRIDFTSYSTITLHVLSV